MASNPMRTKAILADTQRLLDDGKDEAIATLYAKWNNIERKNALHLEKELEALEEEGYDIEDVRGQLDAYKEITRDDYESAEEFQEARDDAWIEVIEAIENIDNVAPPEVSTISCESADFVAVDEEEDVDEPSIRFKFSLGYNDDSTEEVEFMISESDLYNYLASIGQEEEAEIEPEEEEVEQEEVVEQPVATTGKKRK